MKSARQIPRNLEIGSLKFTHVGRIVTSRISYNAIQSQGFFLYYEQIKNISSGNKFQDIYYTHERKY